MCADETARSLSESQFRGAPRLRWGRSPAHSFRFRAPLRHRRLQSVPVFFLAVVIFGAVVSVVTVLYRALRLLRPFSEGARPSSIKSHLARADRTILTAKTGQYFREGLL